MGPKIDEVSKTVLRDAFGVDAADVVSAVPRFLDDVATRGGGERAVRLAAIDLGLDPLDKADPLIPAINERRVAVMEFASSNAAGGWRMGTDGSAYNVAGPVPQALRVAVNRNRSQVGFAVLDGDAPVSEFVQDADPYGRVRAPEAVFTRRSVAVDIDLALEEAARHRSVPVGPSV